MFNIKSTTLFVFIWGLYTVLVSAQNYKCRNPFAIGRNPTDCSKWFRCSYGTPYPMKDCSPGMLFSLIASTCVLKGSVWDDCHIDGKTFMEKCRIARSISIPKPDNCAQFYNCSLPIGVPRPGYLGDFVDECPYPKLFSEETLQCEEFEQVRCKERREIIYACDYKKLQCPVASCRPCLYDFPDCRKLNDGLHPWVGMENTPRYASCLKGRGFPRYCPDQKVYHPASKICVYRGLLTGR